MLEYSSISGHIVNIPIKAYPKYDGINVRVKWTKKKKFVNFGARHTLIEETTPIFGKSVTLWKSKYEKRITDILSKKNIDQCVLFGEYFGCNSFAGYLDPNDSYDLIIFDCAINDKIITQKELLKLLKGVEISPILYEGNPSDPFREKVSKMELESQTFEGVVCKGDYDNRNKPVMFKVKSKAWYKKLKEQCKGDEKLFESLK